MTIKNFRLVERDIDILKALNEYRYLSTNQIHALIFSGNTSLQSARRRLRYLYQAKLVGRAFSYSEPGNGAESMVYFLDRKGCETLNQIGVTTHFYKKAKQVKQLFLNHALALSTFKIHLVRAITRLPEIELETFIPDFELKRNSKSKTGLQRYLSYREVAHPVHSRSYTVYPDAVIVLASGNIKRLFFLEVDRGTEAMRVIRDKVIGYGIYLQSGMAVEYGDFNSFQVLIQTTSPKRENNIQVALSDMEGRKFVRTTSQELVNDESVLNGQIWLNYKNEHRSILKAGAKQA